MNITTYYCAHCLSLIKKMVCGWSPENHIADVCDRCKKRLKQELDNLRQAVREFGSEFPTKGSTIRQKIWENKGR